MSGNPQISSPEVSTSRPKNPIEEFWDVVDKIDELHKILDPLLKQHRKRGKPARPNPEHERVRRAYRTAVREAREKGRRMFFYCLLRARDASTLRRSDSDKFAEIAAARVIFEEYKDNGSGAGFDALYARYARPLASPHRDHFEILSRTPGSGVPAPLDVGESSDSTSSGDDDDDDSSSSSSSSSDDDEDEDSVSTSSDDDGDDDDGHTDSIDSGDEADDDGSDSVDSGDDDDDDDDDHDDHDDDSGDEAICSSSETVDNDDQATDGSSDTVGNGANGGDGEASGHISNNANGRGGNDSNSPAPSILDLFRDGLRESASQGQRRWREIVGNDNWRSQDPCLCRYFGGNLPPRYYCRRHPPPPPPRVEQIEIFQLMAQIWNNHQN